MSLIRITELGGQELISVITAGLQSNKNMNTLNEIDSVMSPLTVSSLSLTHTHTHTHTHTLLSFSLSHCPTGGSIPPHSHIPH